VHLPLDGLCRFLLTTFQGLLNRILSIFCSYPGIGNPVGDNSAAELSDSRLKQFQRHQCAQVTRARHRHGGEQKSQSYRPQVRHNQKMRTKTNNY
jgi:hypothetical protein